MKMSELRKLVRQVISEAGTSSGVAGHSGRRGEDIDDFASGPFKPEKTLTDPLRHQVDSSKKKRSLIPVPPEQKWVDIDTNLTADDLPKYAGKEFTNPTNKMKFIDMAYDFKIVEPSNEAQGFINDTDKMKPLKESIEEASTTGGGTGGTEERQKADIESKVAQKAYDAALQTQDDAKRTHKDAIKTLDKHQSGEPEETVTTTTTTNKWYADKNTTDLYKPTNINWDKAPAGMNTYTSLKNAKSINDLRAKIVASSGGAKANTLSTFDTLYGRNVANIPDQTKWINPITSVTTIVDKTDKSTIQPDWVWTYTTTGPDNTKWINPLNKGDTGTLIGKGGLPDFAWSYTQHETDYRSFIHPTSGKQVVNPPKMANPLDAPSVSWTWRAPSKGKLPGPVISYHQGNLLQFNNAVPPKLGAVKSDQLKIKYNVMPGEGKIVYGGGDEIQRDFLQKQSEAGKGTWTQPGGLTNSKLRFSKEKPTYATKSKKVNGQGDEMERRQAEFDAKQNKSDDYVEKRTTNPTDQVVRYLNLSNINTKPFEFNDNSGVGSKVDQTPVTTSTTETNPDWTNWDNMNTEYTNTRNTAKTNYDTAVDDTANKLDILRKKQEQRDKVYRKTADIQAKLAARGRGRVAKSLSKGRAKGKTKRSSRVGITRGGVPSLASLSGMKTTKGNVKTDRFKKKSKKDEE